MRKSKMYHVFTKDINEWIKNKRDAEKLFNNLKKEYDSVRLYEESRSNKGALLSEKCIKKYDRIEK